MPSNDSKNKVADKVAPDTWICIRSTKKYVFNSCSFSLNIIDDPNLTQHLRLKFTSVIHKHRIPNYDKWGSDATLICKSPTILCAATHPHKRVNHPCATFLTSIPQYFPSRALHTSSPINRRSCLLGSFAVVSSDGQRHVAMRHVFLHDGIEDGD